MKPGSPRDNIEDHIVLDQDFGDEPHCVTDSGPVLEVIAALYMYYEAIEDSERFGFLRFQDMAQALGNVSVIFR
jgi:hypothetical protein